MTSVFNAVKITDRVYWVGAIDWNLRDFHGYATRRGSTYNAYLILADKITLIDTVKAPFKDEMMQRIASVVDPSKINYIVSNHAEMDHSGCLSETMDAVKPEKVFASAMGAKILQEHFAFNQEIMPVKDGEKLSLGNMTLQFMETRMLHWPDSMISYLMEEELLFSQDAFGMHLASAERFDDEVDPSILKYEAGYYYANILLPYSALITKLIEKVVASGLTFKIIAPDHGPIWRTDRKSIIDWYAGWAIQKPTAKAVVTYGTMWKSTEKMALAIGEGIAEGGARVQMMSMDGYYRSDIIYELLDAGALVVGSATLNNNMLPKVADVMTYIRGLKPQNLIGAAFGSYGWSGEAPRQLQDILTDLKVEPVADPLRVKNVPTRDILAQCRELGKTIAAKLKG
jgi:flavorubredoxin